MKDKTESGEKNMSPTNHSPQPNGTEDNTPGTPKRVRGTGSIFTMPNSSIKWVKYHRNGIPLREEVATAPRS